MHSLQGSCKVFLQHLARSCTCTFRQDILQKSCKEKIIERFFQGETLRISMKNTNLNLKLRHSKYST